VEEPTVIEEQQPDDVRDKEQGRHPGDEEGFRILDSVQVRVNDERGTGCTDNPPENSREKAGHWSDVPGLGVAVDEPVVPLKHEESRDIERQ